MSEQQPETETVLPARKRATSVVSLVWLIPLVALLTGIWLLIGTIRNTGPEITLHLPNADGMQAGTTVIKILNVEVGRVTEIKLNEQQNGVVLLARMDASVEKLLREDTHFWVVKPRIDQSGVTGLGTLVSGVYIEMEPGKSTQAREEFTVGDTPSFNAARTTGLYVRLVGKTDRLLAVGSPVLYRNIEVGSVESARFDPVSRNTEYRVFIAQPNDALLGSNTRFWLTDGVNIDMNAGGVKISAPPVGALLSGAIAFDDPRNGNRGAKVAENALFTLYQSKKQVPDAPNTGAVYLVAFFDQSIRSLPQGATVAYKGITVGEVVRVPYFVGDDRARLLDNQHVPVLLYLDPQFFQNEEGKVAQSAWTQSLHRALDRGLNAALASDSLLTGSNFIELSDAAPDSITLKPSQNYGGYRVIATRRGGLDGLQQQLNDLLARFNRLPLDKTVKELNGTLAGINRLLDNKETQALPQEMRQALSSLRTTLDGISPDAPAYRDAQNTLKRLDETLRRAEPLLKTLNEQPNALIFNHNTPDPVPKGRP